MTEDPATSRRVTDAVEIDEATEDPAAVRLAHEIRRLRQEGGLSQPQLARLVGYTRQYVSLAERVGRNLPSVELVGALDTALEANGHLVTLRHQAKIEQQVRRNVLTRSATGSTDPAPTQWPAMFAAADHPQSRANAVESGTSFVLDAPAGRYFPGAAISGVRYSTGDDERIVLRIPAGEPVLRRPGRGLVVGVTDDSPEPRLFGMDTRRARARVANASGSEDVRLLIPRAYELDDLTLAVLWAVANVDDALADDDRELAACASTAGSRSRRRRSTGGRDLGAELSAVSRMWLGSDFCARHILRHAQTLQEVPVFWTREQRGEEASAWVLFAHKYHYLRDTANAFHSNGDPVTRTFCVPHTAVTTSSQPERILLMLAVALMESFGILVEVCTEPEYGATPGFALDARRRAVVADWVGTEELWQVDVTEHRPTVHEFSDAVAYARSHSVIAAPTPVGRLRALADYLDVPWSWLTRRCAQLGDYGAAGLAQPRSRLLSVDGIDRACRYLGDLAGHADRGR